MIRRPPRSTLFPYTTLLPIFESDLGARMMCQYLLVGEDHTVLVDTGLSGTPEEVIIPYMEGIGLSLEDVDERSEEHTSELQSRQYIVCRLLLEKKNYGLHFRS